MMKTGSIQQSFVALESVVNEVMCLASQQEKMVYRAGISVSSMNFLLRSEKEQEALLASYAAFLNSLSFPIQMMVHVRPLNLSPYLEFVEQRREILRSQSDLWNQLTSEYVSFVQSLSHQRAILNRQFLLIIPSGDEGIHDPLTSLLRFVPIGRRKREAKKASQELAIAQGQLALRCEMVIAELARLGLHAYRLGTLELVQMWHSSLDPMREKRPIPVDVLEGIENIHLTSFSALPIQFPQKEPEPRKEEIAG
jgi:hypothetical protein